MSVKRDHRALDHRTLEFLRIRAVECVVEEGKTPMDVADFFGVPVQEVYKWRKMYERGGWKELEAKPIPGRPRKLDDDKAQCVGELVRTETPQTWKMPLALWTRASIATLIAILYGPCLCLASVGNLMDRLRFSCQRPMRRAYEQNPQRIEEWRTTTFPALLRHAREDRARLFFADEAGVRSDYHSGTTWAPIGKTPVVITTGRRCSWNMLVAISMSGVMSFTLNDETLNAAKFITFLQHLLAEIPGKIVLIVDNHSAHRAAQTKAFVATVANRLELHFLPPYAQEHNPSELVWNQVKNHEIGRTSVHHKEELKKRLLASLNTLAGIPRKVASFFQAPGTSYTLAASIA
jgi:transposase